MIDAMELAVRYRRRTDDLDGLMGGSDRGVRSSSVGDADRLTENDLVASVGPGAEEAR